MFVSVSMSVGIANSSSEEIDSYDLVILNGRVMDPETGHDAIKNIAIKYGKIVRIDD